MQNLFITRKVVDQPNVLITVNYNAQTSADKIFGIRYFRDGKRIHEKDFKSEKLLTGLALLLERMPEDVTSDQSNPRVYTTTQAFFQLLANSLRMAVADQAAKQALAKAA